MTVTPGHFTLSAEQRHFQKMIKPYPRFTSYWDFESRSCELAAIEKDIGALSHGEQIMLRFFVAVWTGNNGEFDFIDAARTLDDKERQVIVDWLANPLLP